jgi:hypothetical protein
MANAAMWRFRQFRKDAKGLLEGIGPVKLGRLTLPSYIGKTASYVAAIFNI